MKKNYTAPHVVVMNIQTSEGLLVDLSNGSANGSGTNIKGERFDIDFTDISGQEIVKKNPWDNQW